MINKIQNRLDDLRQQPESVRLQAAIKYTVIAGVVIAVLWLAVFLPLQLTP